MKQPKPVDVVNPRYAGATPEDVARALLRRPCQRESVGRRERCLEQRERGHGGIPSPTALHSLPVALRPHLDQPPPHASRWRRASRRSCAALKRSSPQYGRAPRARRCTRAPGRAPAPAAATPRESPATRAQSRSRHLEQRNEDWTQQPGGDVNTESLTASPASTPPPGPAPRCRTTAPPSPCRCESSRTNARPARGRCACPSG